MLYEGLVAKVLRRAPGGGVLLLVVELMLEVFRQGVSSLVLLLHGAADEPVGQFWVRRIYDSDLFSLDIVETIMRVWIGVGIIRKRVMF